MPRVNSVQEIFEAMPGRVMPEQVGDLSATIQFDLSGEGGGQWYATVDKGTVVVTPGTAPSPNVIFSSAATDFIALVNGELNPMAAFMQGRIGIKGDMALVMRMQSLFARR